MASRTIEEKVHIHERLRELFDTKIRRIPASLFAGRRKPTFQDVVQETESCKFLSGVPEEYDLGWYFHNFNGLARLGFTARKGGDKEQRDLNRAIWFLELDPKHSFGTRLEHARFNMLCMLIVYALPNTDRVCDYPLTATFRMNYKFAWEECIKRRSTKTTSFQDAFIGSWVSENNIWDLMNWNGGQMNAMRRAVEKLRTIVPPLPFSIEDFWMEADLQPEDVREKNAALWAIRWLIHMDDEAQRSRQEAEAEIEGSGWYEQEMLDKIAALGSGELEYLNDPHIFENSDLLKALSVPVDEDIQPLPLQTHTPWMDPSTAISMVKGEIGEVNDIILAMASLEMTGDAMDTTG